MERRGQNCAAARWRSEDCKSVSCLDAIETVSGRDALAQHLAARPVPVSRAIARLQVRLQSAGKRWWLDRRSRRLTDPQERPVALSKSDGKTKSSLLKGKKIDE